MWKKWSEHKDVYSMIPSTLAEMSDFEPDIFKAIKNNKANSVKHLIKSYNPQLINGKDKYGKASLHIAYAINIYELKWFLKKKWANKRIKDVFGRTLYEYPQKEPKNLSIFRFVQEVII